MEQNNLFKYLMLINTIYDASYINLKKEKDDDMKIAKNVGRLDGLLRITFGLSMLGCGISRKSDLLTFYGAAKAAEGLTRFCVMYHLLGITTVNNRFELTDQSVLKNLNRKNSTINLYPTEEG